MRKGVARNYYVRNVNKHLLNVLEESYYIELGSVSLQAIDRLLNGEVLDFKDIIYLKILNEGVGNITNDIKNDYNYQLNYLLSFRQKSSTHKFVLTAGLLKYRDESGIEKFAPIVLIPIDIDYQKRKVRMSSEAIVNRILMRFLSKYKYNGAVEQNKYIDSMSNSRLTNSYQIDKFCLDLSKEYNLSVSPINFLTICNVEYYDFNFKKDLFSIERSIFETDEITLYENYFKKVKAILPANLHQKHAILKAHNGESFAVDGKLGSGKTYTAINIIADAIAKDKKVLYINQDLDNVWEIEKNMKYFGIDSIVMNLITKTSNIDVEPVMLPTTIKDSFDYDSIKFFDKLRSAKSKRIHGFTFDYLSENLAIFKRSYKGIKNINIELDLEKHETEYIGSLLDIIENSLKEIGDFSKNVWHGLQPNKNAIVSDIVEKTINFYSFHKDLTKYLTSYCKSYNLKMPENIHDLNNLTEHILFFETAQPQTSWITKEGRNSARAVLKDIQEAIDENYIALDYYRSNVSSDYKPGRMLEILTEILAKHLSITSDHEYINNLLVHNNELDTLTNKILESAKNAKIEFDHLSDYLNFSNKNVISLAFIKDFFLYLKENSLPRQLANSYISNASNFMVVGSTVYNNFEVIKNVKKITDEIVIPGTRFTYLEAKELVEDVKTKKKLGNYFDNGLIRKKHIDKDELIKKINDYYYASKNIMSVLELKDNKVETEKYWQECANFYHLVNVYSIYSKNIDHFVRRQISLAPIDPAKVMSTLKNIINISENVTSYISKLKKYNINVLGTTPYEQITSLNSWTSYLVKIISLRNEIYQIFKKKQVRIDEIIELVDKDNDYINLLEKINQNESEYIRLLGENYKKFDTVISDTGRAIDHFDYFVAKLNDQSDIDKLLSQKTFEKFLKNTIELRNKHTEWFAFYRLFSICFTHGQSPCQNLPISDVLERLETFKNNVNDVDKMVSIINALEDISKFKLSSLVESIKLGELKENISNIFYYSLYLKYIKMFDSEKSVLVSFDQIKSEFESFEENEQNYCLNNIVALRKLINKKGKSKTTSAMFYEYNKLIDSTIKYNNLYLADLNIFNNGIDLSKFDLVIIDDCHLSSANKYNGIDMCKQVVLLGDKTFQSSVSNSLLQRIGDSSIVQYSNRYVKMTPKFNNVWNNKNRYIYSYDTLVSISPVKSINDFAEKIVTYFLKNPNNVLNVLIGNEETRRDIYISVVTILNMSYSFMDVVEILTYHIRLINVNEEGSKYVNDVFIYYTDFIEYDLPQKNLIFKNFVVVENSVQIYYLDSKVELVNKEIEKDINKTMVKAIVKPKPHSGIVRLFYEDLTSRGIKVKTGFGKFDITIQKSSKYPIAIIFEGTYLTNPYSLIDDYHYYYRQYVSRGWDVLVIYVNDLIDNYDKILNDVVNKTLEKAKK